MRTKARVDSNHAQIVKTFRACGCSVQDLSGVGKGVPDIVVGYCGKNYFIEIKDGEKPPSKKKLTKDEKNWHDKWKGQVCIIENEDEVYVFLAKKWCEK